MKCPKCAREMEIQKVDESVNRKSGAKYERTLYVCSPDDIWVSVETPK